ncbi:MAG: zinc ABC transporter substrate-binding protein, partial [Fimbriimonadaceae bacterium]|nr:zinc ABC transporter substrate-binding protein [Fimbriimonadaceae bacterium]
MGQTCALAWLRRLAAGCLAVACLLATACDSRPPRVRGWDGMYPIKITVTTAMIGDLVKGVGRDRVFIEVLMGPGTDPHLYKASPDDVRKLGEAVGIAYNGLHLEGKMGEVLESMAKKKPTLAVAETLPQSRLIQVGEIGGKPTYDPHVWFDVKLFSEALGPIADWLSEIDPESADFFKANAEDYAFGLSQ